MDVWGFVLKVILWIVGVALLVAMVTATVSLLANVTTAGRAGLTAITPPMAYDPLTHPDYINPVYELKKLFIPFNIAGVSAWTLVQALGVGFGAVLLLQVGQSLFHRVTGSG